MIPSDDLVSELTAQVSGEVHFDQVTRLLYSTDASNYQIEPIGVVFPRDVDDIIAVHEFASRLGIPLLPRGAGTSLAGQSVGQAIVIDMSRYMNRLLGVHGDQETATVQAGMVLGHLNAQLASLGLMVGPDPASADRATIGGCLGNNATGMHSILYGMFGDHVRSIDVVLPDGVRVSLGTDSTGSPVVAQLEARVRSLLKENADEIKRRYPKTWRSVAGYALNCLDPDNLDLARLFAGAEGTLGTVVAVELGLVARPKDTRLVLLHFDDMRAALEVVPAILDVEPSAIELLDKMLLDLTRNHPDYSKLLTFVDGDPQAILIVEFFGNGEPELAGKVARLRERMRRVGFHGAMVVAETARQIGEVMKVRKAGLGLLMGKHGDHKPIPFIEDAAVPVEHLADYVGGVRHIVEESGADMAVYAHASAGCLHIRPLINLKSEEGLQKYRAIAEAVTDLVISYGGTTSGEHGEGLSRGEFSKKLFGETLTEAFRQIKATFDPHGLMNPGKVVDVGPLDDLATLRYGPDYAVPYELPATRFDWSRDGGFAAAVEMCNGAGVCRKENVGVMCPSYMATRDEMHSTRGRANMLRHAMTGRLGVEGLGDSRLYEVLDLCLSCKACKAECPSLVDMARLKAEFLAAYYEKHGVPLRSWVFGHIHRLNQLGSLMPAIANSVLRSPLARSILARLGVTPHRQLPLFAPQRFSVWWREHPCVISTSHTKLKAPTLIADTYTEYNYPHLGQAVVRVAQAAGFEIEVWGPGKIDCCGRPLISKGLLDDARWLATRNIERMAQLAAQGNRFMLIEPSCAATFRDEYPDLVPGHLRDEARVVANAVITVEEWLAELADAGELDHLAFDEMACSILYHGHCYQRALWGTEATLRILNLIPNVSVKECDDGCCGVAGSFGFEAEHYDLSVQIGEQRLLPAIRATPEAIVVASGVSCREQIEHGSGRHALHPVELLAAKLRIVD